MTEPSSRQRGRSISTKPQLSDSNKNLVLGPKWGFTQRLTGRLTVGHNSISTLTLTCEFSSAVGIELVWLGNQSRIDSWSWRSAVGSESSPGASSWRKYRLKQAARVWGLCETVANLQGREPGWKSLPSNVIENTSLCVIMILEV
jgi:hypothetical protein